MHVSNYETTSFPVHLVFLELEDIHQRLDLKILHENNNEIIPKTFCLQLLNKCEYIRHYLIKNEDTDLYIIRRTLSSIH